MKNRGQQQGVTLIGFIFILVLVVMVALLGMKLVPIYQEYYSIKSAMDELQIEPGAPAMSAAELKERLFRKLYVNYVKAIDRSDVKVSTRKGTVVSVDYEVREPIVGNLDVVAKFAYSVRISGT